MAVQIASGVALMYTRYTWVVVRRVGGGHEGFSSWVLRSRSAVTLRSVYLSIHRSWMSRIGHRVEEVQLLPARPAGDHEVRFLEHLEVLHHAEAGHRQLGLELGERAAVTLEEQVEQEPTGRIGQRLEHAVQLLVVGHEVNIGDYLVTCQRLGSRSDETTAPDGAG